MVIVCVSTCVTPPIFLSSSRNSDFARAGQEKHPSDGATKGARAEKQRGEGLTGTLESDAYLRRVARFLPRAKRREWNCRGELEVEATATDSAVDNSAIEVLELWQKLIHDVGDFHERLRGGLATAVVLPLAAARMRQQNSSTIVLRRGPSSASHGFSRARNAECEGFGLELFVYVVGGLAYRHCLATFSNVILPSAISGIIVGDAVRATALAGTPTTRALVTVGATQRSAVSLVIVGPQYLLVEDTPSTPPKFL